MNNGRIKFAVAVEDTEEHSGVLLHVEDDRPVRPAEAGEGGGGRVQAEAGLHSQLVSVCGRFILLLLTLLFMKTLQIYPNTIILRKLRIKFNFN